MNDNTKQSKLKQWAGKEHTYTNKKMTIIIIGTMILGSLLFGQNSNTTTQNVVEKPVEKIVTKEVTPQSCKDVIELDNQIFIKTGEALRNMLDTEKMREMTNFLNINKDGRTRDALDCMSK